MFLYKPKRQNVFFSIWNHHKSLSSFRFIWITMLRGYDHYKDLYYYFSAEIDFRRQNLILTSKVGSRAERVNAVRNLHHQCYFFTNQLSKAQPSSQSAYCDIVNTLTLLFSSRFDAGHCRRGHYWCSPWLCLSYSGIRLQKKVRSLFKDI